MGRREARPAQSALSLRLALAIFGLLVCSVAAVLLGVAGAPLVIVVLLALLALTAVIDIVVIGGRKRRSARG